LSTTRRAISDLVGLGIDEVVSFIEDKANVHLPARSR
jgi:hypothetical protein